MDLQADSGSSDSPNTTRSTVTKVRKIQLNKQPDFISKGGVTGAVIRGVTGAIEKDKAKAKDRKINDSYLGSSDYQGDVSKKPRSVDPRTGKDNDNDPNPKSVEQPKVKSQMNNSEVKSDLITATGPTDIEMANTTEMSEDEKLIS